MKYHPDNEDVYNEIKDNLSCMVPFVGAGLTCFVYNTWPNVLKNLSEKVTNSKNKKTINLLIRNGELEKAAQCLEEFRGPANLARDIANYFSPDKFDKKCHELKEEAIYLFPLVFSDLVLTTNFDSGLEITYQTWERKFQNILHPGHSELLRQLLRNTAGNNLFKFHGNVNGKNIEYDSLVFTLKQYDQHYREDSDLVKELKNCLEKKVMFFLGCSLKEDRTMEVLENIIQKGDYHYTIIGCKKSERDDKVLYLEKKHIRAILYEDNRHEAVKVILEQLLKETKPEAYKELLRYTKKREPSNYFECNEIQVSFYGRKNEINELNVFLSDRDICFRWWAITGPGGSGKSRLAYEFQKQLPEDWDVYRLAHTDYRQLSEISTSFVRKTLIIADYVEEHAQELGVWMEQLAQSMHRFPLRFLLIGRKTGDVSAGFDWNNQQLNIFLSIKNKNRNIQGTELSLAPEKLQDDVNASPSSLLLAGKTDAGFSWERQFYNGIYDRQLIRKTCFRLDYLELKPLSDKALRSIIRDYAVAIRKDNKTGRAMPDRQIEAKLLDKLKAIDPVLCRPLYAMFLTSAYMNGNEPERWGREDVLDYMIERELSRLEF